MKLGKITSVMFIGSGGFALELSHWCRERELGFSVYAAPRHADEVVGSGGVTWRESLEQAGVPVHVSDDINGDARVTDLVTSTTLGIAGGPAWIFRENILNLFKGRLVNFHGIPLPQFRGGAHHTWQILQGHRTGGLNIQLIERKLDAGSVLMSSRYQLTEAASKPKDYFEAASAQTLPFLKKFIALAHQGHDFPASALQEEFSLFMPRLSTANQAFINWAWNTDEIVKFINAFDEPYAGASTFTQGTRVFLKDGSVDFGDGPFHPFQSGLIIRKVSGRLYVVTVDGTLIIGSCRNEAGEEMYRHIRLGARMHTPKDRLDAAMEFSASYDAKGLVSRKSPEPTR